MADFGDPSLFSEFEKPKGPSDRLLRENVLSGKEKSPGSSQDDDNTSCLGNAYKMRMTDNDAGRKSSSSSDDSDDDSNVDSSDDENTSGANNRRPGSGYLSHQTFGSLGNPGNCAGSLGDNTNAELLKTIKKLKSENEFLKKQVRLFDPLLWVNDERGPVMQLIFMQHDFAREFKPEIESFVASLISHAKSKQKGGMGVMRPRPNDICLASVKDMSDPMKRILRLRTSMILNCSQVYEDFVIDMMGSPLVDFNPSLTDGWDVPIYEQVFPNSLPCEEEDEDACPPRKQKGRAKSKCFNCGGDHMISQCPEEKDQERIRRNKKEFMAQSTPKQERYHVEDPRFASFKPGIISENLRTALGLTSKQLPPHIYQMRVLGYPPGWLQEAKKETGLAMYDREGRELDKDGELLEDGEMNEDRVVTRDEFNTDKFVEYPGFNAAMPSDVIDEWQQFGAPPQQPGQDINEMKKRLGQTPTGLKRKKNGETNGSAKKKKRMDMSTSDMDVANSDVEEGGVCSSQASTAPSTPSIDELEKQRELLEQELLASVEESSQDTIPMSSSPATTADTDENVEETTPTGTVLSKTPSGPSIGSSLGTPVLFDIGDKRTSLPDPSKFAKDIEDHIPYENLPDAVGMYDKIRVLLAKKKS